MLTASRPKQTVPLSNTDRQAIASVLTWDLCKSVTPDEVEAIRVTGEWVTVWLNRDRAVPIHREIFRSILRQQQAQDLNYVS